jgi:hypothetical protein
MFSTTGHAFGLTINGVQVIDDVPVDMSPIRWTMPSTTTNGDISFTIEDQGGTTVNAGDVIRLTDNSANELLWSGVVVSTRRARGVGPYRLLEVIGAGWGFFLDHRYVTSFSHTGKAQSVLGGTAYWMANDALLDLVFYWGGPIQHDRPPGALENWGTYDATVTRTTLRGAIEALNTAYDPVNDRWRYYVDNDQQLHVFTDPQVEASPAGYGTGTGLSVGDLGDVMPETLSRDDGAEAHKERAYAYDADGDLVGFTGPYPALSAEWVAGQPTTSIDMTLDHASAPLYPAQLELTNLHGEVLHVTFTYLEAT